MVKLKPEDFIGHWKTEDFPMYLHNDNNIITLYVSDSLLAYLWVRKDNEDIEHIAVGETITHANTDDNTFDIIIKDTNNNIILVELSCKLFLHQNPQAFVCNIPEFGERYFKRIKK